jgi:hypothetical protein
MPAAYLARGGSMPKPLSMRASRALPCGSPAAVVRTLAKITSTGFLLQDLLRALPASGESLLALDRLLHVCDAVL